ncbi:hypothetical protein AERO_16990 [Aeromicrobium fastidiosum]|uniref:BTAD domain-containing putative transcriptional regulator n=1 Tax=Aeromicrobium fastidiosum TaxID=52699 RepID=UPI0020235479|nr:BTAD domain-containing putative transcriptional regulator [Aeromicrobium fastidiosum]MCL8253085.1 hypothetical protein [Aeromicrobium fastidiosum]
MTRIEIRLLGRLRVRRSDGSVVAPQAWTAAKTTDLLRMLALAAGQPVRSETLVERLWPQSSASAGRASLRTATSAIRTTIGSNCVRTHLGALTLVDCWVDALELLTIADLGARAWRTGDAAGVVRGCLRAEALYVGDFHAHLDDQPWASEARTALAVRRQQLLCDAAESALSLFWLRDAIDLATTALDTDPSSERAHRTLMSAFAGLGRTEQALRQFERCRASLADELGADPSEQTRALHLAVLNGSPPVPARVPFVGRTADVAAVVEQLEETHRTPGGGIVCVVGETGSGRHALVDAALETARASTGNLDVWGPFDGRGADAGTVVKQRLSSRDAVLPGTIVVLTTPAVVDQVTAAAEATGRTVRTVRCPPIGCHDVEALATRVLRGSPTPALLGELTGESGCLAGTVVSTLHAWLANGRVVATEAGLDLWDDSAVGEQSASGAVAFGLVIDQLSDHELQVCELLSMAAGPVGVEEVVRAMGRDRRVDAATRSTLAALERLVDLGVLDVTPDASRFRFRFRDPRTRSGVVSWLRPADRTRLRGLWTGTTPVDHAGPVLGRRAGDRGGADRRQLRRGRRATD